MVTKNEEHLTAFSDKKIFQDYFFMPYLNSRSRLWRSLWRKHSDYVYY